MNKKLIIFAGIGIALAIAYVVGNKFIPNGSRETKSLERTNQTSSEATASPPLSANTIHRFESNELANSTSPPIGATQNEKWIWLAEMVKKDKYFEYKAPISFYGKVVDDSTNPIGGVSVNLSWTDANEATGASSQTITTDENGSFSIEGVHGERLVVASLVKQGYTASIEKNLFTFKYGWFSDPTYHAPNRLNPICFIMRRNRESESLLEYSEKRAEVSQGQTKQFTIGPNGLTLLFERMSNDASVRGGWIARLSVPNGGLTLTTEEFPFEAPAEGYADSIIVTNGTPRPSNWPSDFGAMLYFKTAQGHGRIMVRYLFNMDRMFVTSWFNPNPNSRNLELNPDKISYIK